MHTPPVKLNSSSTPSLSTTPSLKPISSLTRLPSLHSSTSLFSPSFGSLHNQPSLPRLPSSLGKPEANGRQNGGSKRSVRWLDGAIHGGKDSRSSSHSSKKTMDPAKVWARYTQTVKPDFRLHEPSRSRLSVREGKASAKGVMVEPEEDNKYVMKLSLPCPAQCSCCFCVYSRQLGPVRVYVSNFHRPRPPPTRGAPKNGNGAAKDVNVSHDHGQEVDYARRVFLKEPWMTSSAPSGEVIVPDLPAEQDQNSRRRGMSTSKLNFVSRDGSQSLRRQQKEVVGKTAPRSKHWLRNSAPPEYGNNHTTTKDKRARHLHNVTFLSDDPFSKRGVWTRGESALRLTKTSLKSHRASAVYIGRDRKMYHLETSPMFNGFVKEPSASFVASPVKVLPKH